MADPETINTSEFEGVVSKVELAVRNREPLELNRDDAKFLRRAFEDAEVRFLLSREAKSRLSGAPMLRVKVAKDEIGGTSDVLIFDYDKPEGRRWTGLKEFNPSGFASKKFEDDRALGLYQMLGVSKFGDLTKWCYEQATVAEYPGKIGGFEGTEGRGLQQAAADLLAIAYNWESSQMVENLTSRLNRRLWKGYRKTLGGEDVAKVDTKFREAEVEEPAKTLASFPPEVLPNLVRFLATKPQA